MTPDAPARPLCLIAYTTLYREGGAELARAARTLAQEREAAGREVVLARVESKRELVDAIEALCAPHGRDRPLEELHFVGHSGMYGPMFRTRQMPEQLSPHEWRGLVGRLRFTPTAEATFHACRTARWFAPFFARTFGVTASGYHWYTTFSARPDRFSWEGPRPRPEAPLYLIGCPGKKSHGLLGALRKRLGLARAEELKRFSPAAVGDEATYARVADLYDEVFADIRVRQDEWRWLQGPMREALAARRAAAGEGAALTVLDVGCGNGALLAALADAYPLAAGVGVDSSPAMVAAARRRQAGRAALRFEEVRGPALPMPDQSVDVVVSLLSFRYLDWDPLMMEVRRVLRPGGRLVVIDMVTAPLSWRDLPRALLDALRAALARRRRPAFRRALARLTASPHWAEMLKYNPIRAEHELVWYLESRFEGRRVARLNLGRHARVLAFDSGPLAPGATPPQSYP